MTETGCELWTMEPVNCVNCGVPNATVVLSNEAVLLLIQRWTAPRLVANCDLICTRCETAVHEIRERGNTAINPHTCVLCNRSLVGARSHPILELRMDTDHHRNIRNTITEWLIPRQIRASHLVCHPCWQRADRAARHYTPPSSSKSPQIRCISCGVNLTRARRHMLYDVPLLGEIQNLIAPRVVTETDFICHTCFVTHDEQHVAVDDQNAAVDEQRVAVDEQHVAVDEQHVAVDEQHVAVDEQRVAVDEQYVAVDEQRVAVDEQHVGVAEQHVAVEEQYIAVDEQHVVVNMPEEGPAQQQLFPAPHRHICLGCGIILDNMRTHNLHPENMLRIVQRWVAPRQVQEEDRICHPCWIRAGRAVQREQQPDPGPAPSSSITLPDYSRAASTHGRCIFPNCVERELKLLPIALRKRLFNDFNYYVPLGCRICVLHLNANVWADLIFAEPITRTFTAAHIQDFCALLKNNKVLEFENIYNMEDCLVWYWLGRTKNQFREIEMHIPQFPNKLTALVAYLVKLRTGDSDERLATLLNIPKSSFNGMITKARELMTEYFVPLHLGLSHITRQQVAERNLLIPNALFGNPESPLEDRKAVVIMDGTYIFVQKSSNYLYQKDTYSLHKYTNLVKPFMIVSSDGYIIDVLGPYSATTSDADILSNELRDPANPLRQYFREGDIFILDRGFRNAIPLLEACNYDVHFPRSLQQGERQLTTSAANESRKVTICRWVVEVVNGRIKRDFKIFRHRYFNQASRHLMEDFRVAAAVTNSFHPVISDRDDAPQIVATIEEKMNLVNTLGQYVLENDLNRRRAQFVSINVDGNNIDFPEMTFSELISIALGTYQIKQARSYYGEHIRRNGVYTVEVCREVDRQLLIDMVLPDTTWLLRGRIQSRHVRGRTYFVYMLVDEERQGRDAIVQYYCTCIVGRRTVGCCAHVMTIIWFLSWASHQGNIAPPAQFLDDCLIVLEEE